MFVIMERAFETDGVHVRYLAMRIMIELGPDLCQVMDERWIILLSSIVICADGACAYNR